MTPYSGLAFFYLMLVLFIPSIVLGLLGKKTKWYNMFVNLVFLAVIFGDSKLQVVSLLAYFFGELVLVYVYMLLRKRFDKRYLLWLFILFSLVPLILVKCQNIFIHRPIGFLGISYLTFKVIGILIEIYDGLIKEINVFDFTYFLLFFPTITSGPIDRSRRFIEDIEKVIQPSEYQSLLREGLFKLSKGIIYKFVIGTLLSMYWMNEIPKVHTFLNTINYMYAYSFYLFFDFAGYSFMAVGASYILGVRTPDNFKLPFLSKDIKDFWNRWHMSLSFWFRDFIYTRFVMSAIKKKWFKSRYTASYIGYLITMGTMGLWHGFEKYYIIYGIYHGLLICITDFFERKSKWYKKVKNNELFNIVSVFITFNFVCFGFLIFSGYLFK